MALPPDDNRATATGNMHRNLVKFGRVVFEICGQTNKQINRQTNKQTFRNADRNTSHLYGGEVEVTIILIHFMARNVNGIKI